LKPVARGGATLYGLPSGDNVVPGITHELLSGTVGLLQLRRYFLARCRIGVQRVPQQSIETACHRESSADRQARADHRHRTE